MSRSIKKGEFVDAGLIKKVLAAADRDDPRPIRTWSRRSQITPDFIGRNLEVHNGKGFIPVHITENMVGHRVGEFAPTRTFKGHQPHTRK